MIVMADEWNIITESDRSRLICIRHIHPESDSRDLATNGAFCCYIDKDELRIFNDTSCAICPETVPDEVLTMARLLAL